MPDTLPAEGPERITRIEFAEILPGRIQWRLWSGDRLNHAEVLQATDLAAAVDTSLALLQDLV